MEYKEVITTEAVKLHLKMIKEREAKEDQEREIELRQARDRELAIAEQLSPAVERSKTVWPLIEPLVKEVTKTIPNFEIIASYIKDDFICAGSYPAAKLASV